MNIEWCYCEANEETYDKLKEDGYEPNMDSIELDDSTPLYYVIEDKEAIWKSIVKPNSFQKIYIYAGQWEYSK